MDDSDGQKVGLPTMISVVVGSIIGAGIFVLPVSLAPLVLARQLRMGNWVSTETLVDCGGSPDDGASAQTKCEHAKRGGQGQCDQVLMLLQTREAVRI